VITLFRKADGETKGIHPAQEQAMRMADGGKMFCQICNVPLKCRPVWPLVNRAHDLRTFCGEYETQTPHLCWEA